MPASRTVARPAGQDGAKPGGSSAACAARTVSISGAAVCASASSRRSATAHISASSKRSFSTHRLGDTPPGFTDESVRVPGRRSVGASTRGGTCPMDRAW